MSRTKGEPKVAVQMYLPKVVYDDLVAQLAGTQSMSSYILQKSGIVQEYRTRMTVTPGLPVPKQVLEARTCETCTLVQCDPSCPLAKRTY